jgi:hypothetical protein
MRRIGGGGLTVDSPGIRWEELRKIKINLKVAE